MVLSMLSAVQSVKLPPSTNQPSTLQQQQQPPPSSKPTSTSSTATTASSATTTTPPGGENLMIRAGDMSRRKQKNPKPFFTSNEDQEDQQQQQHQQQQHRREVEEDNKSCDGQNNNLNSSFNSNQSDEEEMEPPEDLSSLVKVEMEEGFGPVIDTTTTTTATARTSSSSAATYTPSPPPHPSGSRLPLPPGLMPHFPPPPPLSRISADPFASGHHPKEMPNMFHFGDVSVNHHPDTPPVPMVIPMVYLYPLPSHDQGIQEVRYRMFVPLGAPVEALPGFQHPPPPHHLMQDLGRSEMTSHVTKTSRKSTSTNDNNLSTTPLDLRKSPGTRSTDSPSGQTDEECILPDRNMTSPGRSGRSPSGSRQTPDPNSLKQKEIEAQLQFLKAKQIEFFQTQQKQAAAAAAAAAVAAAKMSRCEECNINFSKYQNYVAHKKYYCSASAKSNPPPAPVQVASDNEDDEPVAGPAPKHNNVKQENGSSSHSRGTPTPPHSASTPSLPKSYTPISGTGMTSPNTENSTKEQLKLVKQQDLLQDSAAPALLLPGLPTNHFNCEGCGIKFKSVSNLQAHQARYCAGLRKSDEMTSIEAAIIKRSHQQKQHRVSPPQLPLQLTAAEMMTFLNAKSIEQQLAVAAAQAAQAAALSKEKQSGGPPSISSVMAAAAAASALAGTSAGPMANGGSAADDYCCILCGYKEQSVERLKDHINLHFISQMKRPAPMPAAKSPRSASNGSASTNGSTHEDGAPEPKRIKTELTMSSPRPDANATSSDEEEHRTSKNGADIAATSPRSSGSPPPRPPLVLIPNLSPSGPLVTPKLEPGLRCHACDIGFSHLSNLMAHKKFYCRGLQSVGGGVERHSP